MKKAAKYEAQDQGTARYGVTQFSDLTGTASLTSLPAHPAQLGNIDWWI